MQALGSTALEIAWHKAGIFKAGRPAFAVEQVQFPETEEVLRRRAFERGTVPDLRLLPVDPRLEGVRIRPDAPFQKRNASLAVALAEAVLRAVDPDHFSMAPAPGRLLPQEFVDGLEQVVWRGRCEVKLDGRVVWHIDGAIPLTASRWRPMVHRGMLDQVRSLYYLQP